MTLDDLKALDKQASGHDAAADNLSRWAKEAAQLRRALQDEGGRITVVEVPGLSAYYCTDARERLGEALMTLAPDALRVIELRLEAEAKVERTKAELLRQQVQAAIVPDVEA